MDGESDFRAAGAKVLAKDYDAAETLIRACIAAQPERAEAHVILAYILAHRGRVQETIAACREALRLNPELAEAHSLLANSLLALGDFGPGFAELEWRKRNPLQGHQYRRLLGREWKGEPLAGRRLLVQAETGFGETIFFSRYAFRLAETGASVIVACDPALVPLLAGQQPGVDVRVRLGGSVLPAYDFWTDQISLPLRCGTLPDTIPFPSGWLQAPAATGELARALGKLPERRKAGLVWAGSVGHGADPARSLPFAQLRQLAAMPGAVFVSLQVGPRSGEAEQAGVVADLSPHLTDFGQTAAAIEALDLVISVDTAVAHLAGALGKPVWIMLPYVADWRWMRERSDSVWYRSARLFRQPAPGNWTSVVEQISAALAPQRM